jgi:tight adherence protein C
VASRSRRTLATDKPVDAAMSALARRGEAWTPKSMAAQLERRIVLAGQPAAWPLERVFAVKVGIALVFLLFGLVRLPSGINGGTVFLLIVLPALGYFVPDLILLGRAQERQQLIARELPDTLDQITICVEAGLGFEAAAARAARQGKGPLAEELARTLQDIQIGVSRTHALRELADRTEVAPLRHFVLAVVQAEAYGIAIAQVLRVQAAEMREIRRQNAEERALKLPVKVVFPLIFCIMPALFIVVLGPAGIRLFQNGFGGGG